MPVTERAPLWVADPPLRPPAEMRPIDYIRTLWRYRWLLIVSTVLCAAVTYVATIRIMPTYEAKATLMVAEAATPTVVPGAAQSRAARFRVLLENRGLAARAIAEFGLDKSPYHLTANTFVGDTLRASIDSETQLLTLQVRLNDPELAARVANRVADLAIDLGRSLAQGDSVATRDFVKTQLDATKTRMDTLASELVAYRGGAQTELGRKDADALLAQRGTLPRLTIDIESEKARIAKAQEQLKDQPRTLSVPRLASTSAALINNAREAEDGLDLGNTFINPVFEVLEYQVLVSQTRLAALERERSELVGKLKLDSAQLRQLSVLYKNEIEEGQIQANYDFAKRSYADLAVRYEQARIQAAENGTPLRILDRALPPDAPISSGPMKNAAIAAMLGLSLMLVAVFLFEYVASVGGLS